MSTIQFYETEDGRRIAFRFALGVEELDARPALVFLPGYMSDMDGGKATATMEWAQQHGRSCLLLDYSGCGSSSGEFSDGSLSRWCEEVLALVDALDINKVALIGSSMGGWLMLLVGLALGDRLSGMIGIAAAPDFSDWGFNDEQKVALSAGETIFEDNPYGPEPTPTYALFWQNAETHRLLDSEIAIHCPVRLLHGQRDEDVPWETSMKLAKAIRSDDVQLSLVKDGDHRLSRDGDIALLLQTIASLG